MMRLLLQAWLHDPAAGSLQLQQGACHALLPGTQLQLGGFICRVSLASSKGRHFSCTVITPVRGVGESALCSYKIRAI